MSQRSGQRRSFSELGGRRVPRGLGPRRSGWLVVLGAWLLQSIALPVGAGAEPVLHEYIDLGPGQDPVEPVVTGQRPERDHGEPEVSGEPGSGGLDPAGLNPGAEPEQGALTPGAPLAIDRDTSRPSRVSYEDPFTPSVVPFKRGLVYDAVTADGELVVWEARLRPVLGPGAVMPSDETFHAALTLDVRRGVNLPIPSVAPGSRLVVAHASPAARLSFWMDSAENWFVRADSDGQLRLTLQLVADRRIFGTEFRDASWSELAPQLVSVPAQVKSSALEVARALGVAQMPRPREAVQHLVEHFRRFRPSSRKAVGYGLALYRDLALSGRGICRHRAYAFMLTALGLGIPTRMALNEAHAWVEVYDGELWHRIDLGGAAEQIDLADADRQRQVEPRDPFNWPDASESGHALAQRGAGGRSGASPPAAPLAAGQAEATPGGSVAQPERAAADPGVLAEEDDSLEQPQEATEQEQELALPEALPALPPAGNVTLARGAPRAERGKALFISGRVAEGRRACSGVSVEVGLGARGGQTLPLGTLISDSRGNFGGSLVVPWNAPLGEHSVTARALGGCPGAADAPAPGR